MEDTGLKKVTYRQKRWYYAKSKKRIRVLHRRNKSKPEKKSYISNISINQTRRGYTVHAPEILSIVENQEETLDFFAQALHIANIGKDNQEIFFDLSNVKTVSPESVMYIIAILRNVKSIKAHKLICKGNSPNDPVASKVFLDAGFYLYVYCPSVYNTHTNESIQITDGKTADGILAGKICDYVRDHSSKYSSTKRLYPMIIELMTNTRQHAYRRYLSEMEDNWYVYVENRPECILFVFLDTGIGIPYTIRKGFKERVKELFITEDAKFITSALKGDFRTETGLEHRGKGLPEIYKISQDEIIADLMVISGKGVCYVRKNGLIEEYNLNTSFIGTMFSWKYIK